VPACSEPGHRLGQSLPQRCDDMRTLAIAFTMVSLPWHAEAQTPRLFENDRVVAWRLAPGKRAEPLLAEGRLPGVMVILADGAVRIVDDVNTAATRDVATALGVVLIAIKAHRSDRLETPLGMTPAFPREGARRVVENDRVAVWHVTWTKGLKTPRHFHDKDVVAVYLDPGTVRSIALSGETASTPRAVGDAVFLPRGRAHIEECIVGPRRDIIIELK
jgi:hypothetical protein